jgi:hypothetical protein
MANICLYKIKVKGRKRACYALVDMMPLYSWEKDYISEEGTEDDFALVFIGACKWSVDCYTSPMTDPKPFTDEELNTIQDGDHWDKTMRDKSVLLNCEIFCNSKDIDDSCWSVFEHYDRGRVICDECPKELHIKRGRDYDQYDDEPVVALGISSSEDCGRKCKVKFEGGAYYYAGDYEIGDIVYSDGSMNGKLGRITAVADNAFIHGLQKIKEKVGHADPFVEEDVEAIWKSFKPKDRKEYLRKMGLDEAMTKKKFITVVDYKWTKYALQNNDWQKFIEQLTGADSEFANL